MRQDPYAKERAEARKKKVEGTSAVEQFFGTIMQQAKGEDGKTPKFGVDFLTPAEMEAIKVEIVDRIPKAKDGEDPDYDLILKYIVTEVEKVVTDKVSKLPKPKDGKPGKDAIVDIPSIVDSLLKVMPKMTDSKGDSVDYMGIKDYIDKQVSKIKVQAPLMRNGGTNSLRQLTDVVLDGLSTDAKGNYILGVGGSSLPDQTGNNGKFLTTDGTDPSWATLTGGGDMAAIVYDPAGGAEQIAFASELADYVPFTGGTQDIVLDGSAPRSFEVGAVASGAGNDVSFRAGGGAAGNNDGGWTYILGGPKTGTGLGGNVVLQPGTGGVIMFQDTDVSRQVEFDMSGLSSDYIYALPDKDGTLATLDDITGGSVSDGDKGDITVSASGATWTIDDDAVTTDKIADAQLKSLAGLTPGIEGRMIESDGLGGFQMIAASDAVTAAGALMDSEVTNLTQVKAFDSADYATAAQGATADSAVQPGDLATVATTGDYNDLSNKPDLSVYDNFEQYANLAAFPGTGSVEIIYLAQDTGLIYRWNGSSYSIMSAELALGETSSTAYRGDRGKTAYDHSQLTSGNPHNVTKSDVGLSSVPNTDFTSAVAANTAKLTADTTNVTAAGALMDSELADITFIKALSDAVSSDINTGNDPNKVVTADALAGSNLGIRYATVTLNGSTDLTTDDKAYYRIPAALTGMNLVSVTATVGTGAAGSSSSGTPTFTVKNVTDGNQMLSTSLTVDAGEYTSATAAVPAVINTSTDDVVTDDLIEVACTTAGTGVTYAQVVMGYQLA